MNRKLASSKIDELFANAKFEKGVRIISAAFNDINADMLRTMCQRVLDSAPKTVVVIAGMNGDKVTFACACGEEARAKGANAGKIVKAVASVAGGNGGGKPDLAMAGAKDVTKVDEALLQVRKIVLDMVNE